MHYFIIEIVANFLFGVNIYHFSIARNFLHTFYLRSCTLHFVTEKTVILFSESPKFPATNPLMFLTQKPGLLPPVPSVNPHLCNQLLAQWPTVIPSFNLFPNTGTVYYSYYSKARFRTIVNNFLGVYTNHKIVSYSTYFT